MYIAPSNDHLLLTHKLPFKVILRKFEVVSSWSENAALFQKIDENSFISTNTILWL